MSDFSDTFIGRPNTVATYRSLFKNHIEPFVWGESHKNEQWAQHMIKYWNEISLSKRTQQILIRMLRDYISYMGGPEINIKKLKGIITRSEQQEEVKVLNKAEAQIVMEKCQALDPRFYPILMLGLHGGLRRGEIFGLRCGDTDLFKGRIRVAHSYDGPTKNGKTRYVPMSKALEGAMLGARNLLMRPIEQKIFERMDPNPKFRRICIAAGIEPMKFHSLRHTFATLALENGVSPRTVADWLGHSSVTTTLSIYWNLTKNETNVNEFLP